MWGELEVSGEEKKEGLPSDIEGSPIWSGFLNEVRTYFEGEYGCPG
jgi:hypothetical protein